MVAVEPKSDEMHYLERELYGRVHVDRTIFDFLQDSSLDGIWYWDMESPENEWYSDRFAEVFGYDPDEIPPLSSWWQERIFADDLKLVYENLELHCADPSHPYDQVVRYRHKEGKTVWIRCRGLVVRNKAGTPIRMLGAHTDVTALKESEEEARRLARRLKHQRDELERANRELRTFANVLAHDLKQPARNVSTYLGLLQDAGPLEPEAQEFVQLAQEAAHRMARMLTDVLELATLETDRLELQAVDLNEVVAEAMEILTPNDATYEVAELPIVSGAWGQLVRVFQNVFGNAIKYAKPGSTPVIRVTLSDSGSPMHDSVTISDDGIGFDEAFADRVFEPFHQLNPDRSDGSGIGLSVVRKVIELHGGHVCASSTPGEGTAITLVLPARSP